MTDWRKQIHTYLDSKTDFKIINAMQQFTEPESYVSYYALNDETESLSMGDREYNATDDLVDISYSPIPNVILQIDVRGNGAFYQAQTLYYGFQKAQDELKALGIYYRAVGSITPIPSVQNGYVKEGFQFNLFFSYDTTLVSQKDYIEGVVLYGN